MLSSSVISPVELWAEYSRLEKDFLESLHFVPLTTEHNLVWSPHFADLLLRIGSNVDSFFKNAIFDPTLDSVSDIELFRKRARNEGKVSMLTMKDYKNIFGNFYNLSSKRVVVIRKNEVISPFSRWSTESVPQWWEEYNAIKHDRFYNQKNANLQSVLEGLAAFFLLFITHLETRQFLIDIDFFSLGGVPKERAKEVVLCKIEPLDAEMYFRIYGKSSLFGYAFEFKNRPISDEDRIKIFQLSTPQFDRVFLK
jgi:hypothetical protein